jgi:hypothetical protein
MPTYKQHDEQMQFHVQEHSIHFLVGIAGITNIQLISNKNRRSECHPSHRINWIEAL